MRCPKCGRDGARYIQRREDFLKTREKRFKRNDFRARCKYPDCEWEGLIA